MAPETRPWWRCDADTDESDKLAALSGDPARWAWFRTMCRAKTQRRMGVFRGDKHLKSLLGTHGRYVPELIRVGILHTWPADCARCAQDYSGDAEPGDLIVHDYRRKQRDPTAADRAARRYEKARDPHGDSHADPHGDSHAKNTPSSRALSPSPSTSLDSPNGEPYQVSADVIEPYRTLEELTRFPVQRVGRAWIGRLDGLSDRRTVEAVVAGMRAVAPTVETQPPSPEQLVMALQKHLEPFDRAARNGHKPKGRGPDLSEVDRAFGDR